MVNPLISISPDGPPGFISFIYALPDPNIFPIAALQNATKNVLKKRPLSSLQYGLEQGDPHLIDFLLQKINKEEGSQLNHKHLTITEGATHALAMICSLFTKPNDCILVEAPTYWGAIKLFLVILQFKESREQA